MESMAADRAMKQDIKKEFKATVMLASNHKGIVTLISHDMIHMTADSLTMLQFLHGRYQRKHHNRLAFSVKCIDFREISSMTMTPITSDTVNGHCTVTVCSMSVKSMTLKIVAGFFPARLPKAAHLSWWVPWSLSDFD